jgi:hypothetical protein
VEELQNDPMKKAIFLSFILLAFTCILVSSSASPATCTTSSLAARGVVTSVDASGTSGTVWAQVQGMPEPDSYQFVTTTGLTVEVGDRGTGTYDPRSSIILMDNIELQN